MDTYQQFQEKLNLLLEDIDPDTLSYNKNEYWMIQADYEYVEYYAYKHQLLYTAIALPLARGLHDGDHRKSTLMKNDITYRLPYVIHPLQVCRMLIDLQLPLPREDEDILLAAALCHAMIEDIPFLDHGKELMVQYHLPVRVYEIVKTVSKRKDFTEEEELNHFQEIAHDPLATLIKLSDRGNNVEDLYNRSFWKVHEYVGETKKYFIPICAYGIKHHEELRPAIMVLRDKIFCLTDAAEILVDRYHEREEQLKSRIEELKQENASLRETWRGMWPHPDIAFGRED